MSIQQHAQLSLAIFNTWRFACGVMLFPALHTARYTGQAEAAGWGNQRGTLCVSSQVGCQMGCTFCATGE